MAFAESLEYRALLAAGAFDTSFDFDGHAVTAFNRGGSNSDAATAVAIQSDGKIVVAGVIVRSSSGDKDFGVVRYNSNGSLDTSFGTGGRAVIFFDVGGNLEDVATGVAIQSNGRIVVTGYATTNSSGKKDFAIARLNTNGSLDTSFSGDGKQTVSFGASTGAEANGVVIQSNGRIVVVGTKFLGDGDHDMAIARLTTSGTLDTSFSGDGLQTVAFDLGPSGQRIDKATAVVLQSDGKIVLAGHAQRNADDRDIAVARLTTSGNLDTSFDQDGRQTISILAGQSEIGRAVAMSGSKIVVAGDVSRGTSGDTDFAIARLNSNGSLDSSFDGDGRAVVFFDRGGDLRDVATSVQVQSDGRIVVAGHARTGSSDRDIAVARLNSNGSLDNSFGASGKRTSSVAGDDIANALRIQSNGRLVVAGLSTATDADFRVSRLMNS